MRKLFYAFALLVAGSIVPAGNANASLIVAGYDFYTTLSAQGLISGQIVALEGNPFAVDPGITPAPGFHPGATPGIPGQDPILITGGGGATAADEEAEEPGDPVDTIDKRLEDGPPDGGSATINIELVALSLRSVAPVDLGGTLVDIELVSGTMFGQQAFGTMDIFHNPDGLGGIFNLNISYIFEVTAFLAGTSDVFVMDVDSNSFNITNAPWAHTVEAAVPIPAALPLFGTALLGLGFAGYRRRKASAA